MKLNLHKETLEDTHEDITAFEIETRKGFAMGFLHNKILKIHHIGTNKGQQKPVKGIMDILTRKFKTNKFIFQMLINDNIKESIRGEIIKIPANAKGNPFGEELQELHGIWNEC